MADDKEREIQLQFLDEAQDHLQTLESVFIGLSGSRVDGAALNGALRAAHSMKGGGSLMGFPILSRLSHCLEDGMKVLKIQKKSVELDDRLEYLLLSAVDCLRSVIEGNRQQVPPTDDWLTYTANPIFDELYDRLGDPSEEDAESVLSPEDGADILPILFETEVEGCLQRIEALLETEDKPCLREELLILAQELGGLGAMLQLDAFSHLCASIAYALQADPTRTLDIAYVAVAEWRRSQSLVLTQQLDLLPNTIEISGLDIRLAPNLEPTDFLAMMSASQGGMDENHLISEPNIDADEIDGFASSDWHGDWMEDDLGEDEDFGTNAPTDSGLEDICSHEVLPDDVFATAHGISFQIRKSDQVEPNEMIQAEASVPSSLEENDLFSSLFPTTDEGSIKGSEQSAISNLFESSLGDYREEQSSCQADIDINDVSKADIHDHHDASLDELDDSDIFTELDALLADDPSQQVLLMDAPTVLLEEDDDMAVNGLNLAYDNGPDAGEDLIERDSTDELPPLHERLNKIDIWEVDTSTQEPFPETCVDLAEEHEDLQIVPPPDVSDALESSNSLENLPENREISHDNSSEDRDTKVFGDYMWDADDLNADDLNADDLNDNGLNSDELNDNALNDDDLNDDDFGVDDLDDDDLNVNDLSVDDLDGDNLNVNDLGVDALDVDDLNVNALNGDDLDIDVLNVDALNGDDLNSNDLNGDDLNIIDLDGNDLGIDDLNGDDLNIIDLEGDDLDGDDLNGDDLDGDDLNGDDLGDDDLNIADLNVTDLGTDILEELDSLDELDLNFEQGGLNGEARIDDDDGDKSHNTWTLEGLLDEFSEPDVSPPDNSEIENLLTDLPEVESSEIENFEVENFEVENFEVENFEVENFEVENFEVDRILK